MGLFGESVEELYAQGQKYYKNNQYDDAIKLFNGALKKTTDSGQLSQIHAQMGKVLNDSGRREEAVKEYRAAIKLNTDNAFAHYSLSYYYATEGSYDEAIREARMVIELNRGNVAEAYGCLSYCYASKGQYDDAIRVSREAIRLFPNESYLHNNLAVDYGKIGLLEEAVIEYKKALQLAPDNREIEENLRIAEERLKAKSSSPQQNAQGPVIIQKEIVREIVKVPCQYCGTLIDITLSKCPGCGAPFSIRR